MKAIYIIGSVISAVVIYFFIVGYASKPKTAIGLVEGKLAVCSSKPNCVCSEHDKDDSHSIEPVSVVSSVLNEAVKKVLLEMGAEIVTEQDDYIAATFTSHFFSFIDDFEIRLDRENQLVHVRSASRVGHSDFGVNRKRVMKFKVALDSIHQKE